MEKQVTLDVVALAELRKAVEEVKNGLSEICERITKIEADVNVTETGLHLIYAALEGAGLMKNGEPTQKTEKAMAAVAETPFTILKWDPQQGAKIGLYDVAYKPNNLMDKWTSAHNILRQSNSTIKSRYYGQDYIYSYWLYGENKIYRQKLKAKP